MTFFEIDYTRVMFTRYSRKVESVQYDTDVTVWSPEERLLQVEYAMESVKKRSACIGLKSEKAVDIAQLLYGCDIHGYSEQ